MKMAMRQFARWSHLWLGLIAGAFICLMGVSGGLAGLKPQIAMALAPAPAPVKNCQTAPDWNRAAADASALAHADINRIYGPASEGDPRWHFRMATDDPILFKHVIYDACAGRVLGQIHYGWMDWTVDLHHNLLDGRAGRQWTGAIGIAMLVSGVSGLLLWLLARPDPRTAFRIRPRFSKRTPRELHRAFGLGATVFLTLEAFTGLWFAFPQTMRGAVEVFAPVTANVRPARPPKDAPVAEAATLGEVMAAAHAALPDGQVQEIRLPEGNGNFQVRMWRKGDIRSMGNNVVSLSRAGARVVAIDRYAERAAGNRFIQTMAALHYDEWGGLPFRVLSAVAGLATPLLYVSGILIWWYSRPRKRAPAAPRSAPDREAALVR